jgi:hypothetical protein
VTAPVVVQGIATPDSDKLEAVVYEFPVGAAAAWLTFTCTKHAYDLANNLRIKWLEASAAELALALVPGRCDVSISGDPEHIITITVEDSGLTQLAHVDTALGLLVADITALGFSFVTAGNNLTAVTLLDITPPGNPAADYQLSGNYERNLYYLPGAIFTDYFAANPGLQDGDTLAVEFIDFQTKREACATNPGSTTIAMSSLFNTREYPARIPNCIPLCKRVGDVLMWRDGTYVQPNQGVALALGEHGRTVTRILDYATTIFLTPHVSPAPLTVAPVSVSSTLQSCLNNLADFINKKPTLNQPEVVTSDWTFTGHLFVTTPGAGPIVSDFYHQIVNENYTGTTDSIFFDISNTITGVSTPASDTHVCARALTTLDAAVSMQSLQGFYTEANLTTGTVTGTVLGLGITAITDAGGVTGATEGLYIVSSVEGTSTYARGTVVSLGVLSGASVNGVRGTAQSISLSSDVVSVFETRYICTVSGTVDISGSYTGFYHSININAGAGSHALGTGFIGEHFVVDIDKALTLAADPFYGKLAAYSFGANVGNDTYLDAITFVRTAGDLTGTLWGSYKELDISGMSTTGVRFNEDYLIQDALTAVSGGVYHTYFHGDLYAGSLNMTYYTVDAKATMSRYRGGVYDLTCSVGGISGVDSIGIENNLTLSAGTTLGASTKFYGSKNRITIHGDTTGTACAINGYRSEISGNGELSSTGHIYGFYSTISSLDTCGNLIGYYSEINAAAADASEEQIGFKSKIPNLKLKDTIYALDAHADHGEHILQMTSYSDDATEDGNIINLRRSRGSVSTESALATIDNDFYGRINFGGVTSANAWENESASIYVRQVGVAGVTNAARMTIAATQVYISGALDLTIIQNNVGNPDATESTVIKRAIDGLFSTIDGGVTGRIAIIINDSPGGMSITFDTAGNISAAGSIRIDEAKAFVYYVSKWMPID